MAYNGSRAAHISALAITIAGRSWVTHRCSDRRSSSERGLPLPGHSPLLRTHLRGMERLSVDPHPPRATGPLRLENTDGARCRHTGIHGDWHTGISGESVATPLYPVITVPLQSGYEYPFVRE